MKDIASKKDRSEKYKEKEMKEVKVDEPSSQAVNNERERRLKAESTTASTSNQQK